MRRTGAEVPPSGDESIGGLVMVISGSIRNPDEEDALSVTLSISDAEITMRADEVELGNWPSADVSIRPIDSTSFEFIAEGDRLIFMPDDPTAFGGSPLVGGGAASTGSRKGRRSKKKSGGSSERRLPRVHHSPQEGRRFGWRSAAQKQPMTESSKKPSKPSRQDRKAAAEAARAEVVPTPPSTVSRPIAATSDDEQPAADPAPSRAHRQSNPRREGAVQGAESDKAPSTKPKEKRNGAWIRALDTARKYDIFGLGRVPIDDGLHGQEHEHTWDHRVAAAYGLGKHICTICGRIRR